MKKLLLTLALALATTGAQATLLSELFNGGTITAGDKLFDNWSRIFYDSSDGRTFDPSNIDVTALNDGGDNPGPGLRFDVLDGELSVTGNGIYAYIDLTFGFRASVLPGVGKQIKDNSLSINAGSIVTNAGDNGMYVLESIGTTAGSDDLGTKDIEFSYRDPDLIADLTASAAFAPHGEIWVTKNILVWATGTNETATLSGFQQRFSQQEAPEPGSLALLVVALGGLGAAMRRRRS